MDGRARTGQGTAGGPPAATAEDGGGDLRFDDLSMDWNMIIFDKVTSSPPAMGGAPPVLASASFVLPADQRVAVLGDEGSGKTTLIRLLSGLLLPAEGTITRYARLSYPVGYIGGFKRTMSVRENASHAARLYGADVDEVVEFVSKVTGVGDDMKQPFMALPQQMRVRIGYALSYAIPFDTYLVDNLVAVGDAEFRQLCERMFEERMKQAGCIIATKQVNYVRKYANRVAILANGQVTLHEDVEEAIRIFESREGRRVPPRRRRARELAVEEDEG